MFRSEPESPSAEQEPVQPAQLLQLPQPSPLIWARRFRMTLRTQKKAVTTRIAVTIAVPMIPDMIFSSVFGIRLERNAGNVNNNVKKRLTFDKTGRTIDLIISERSSQDASFCIRKFIH